MLPNEWGLQLIFQFLLSYISRKTSKSPKETNFLKDILLKVQLHSQFVKSFNHEFLFFPGQIGENINEHFTRANLKWTVKFRIIELLISWINYHSYDSQVNYNLPFLISKKELSHFLIIISCKGALLMIIIMSLHFSCSSWTTRDSKSATLLAIKSIWLPLIIFHLWNNYKFVLYIGHRYRETVLKYQISSMIEKATVCKLGLSKHVSSFFYLKECYSNIRCILLNQRLNPSKTFTFYN